jgi:hypothetical protein
MLFLLPSRLLLHRLSLPLPPNTPLQFQFSILKSSFVSLLSTAIHLEGAAVTNQHFGLQTTYSSTALRIRGCWFAYCRALSRGGALFLTHVNATLALSGFTSNNAIGSGGAVSADGPPPILVGETSFRLNAAGGTAGTFELLALTKFECQNINVSHDRGVQVASISLGRVNLSILRHVVFFKTESPSTGTVFADFGALGLHQTCFYSPRTANAVYGMQTVYGFFLACEFSRFHSSDVIAWFSTESIDLVDCVFANSLPHLFGSSMGRGFVRLGQNTTFGCSIREVEPVAPSFGHLLETTASGKEGGVSVRTGPRRMIEVSTPVQNLLIAAVVVAVMLAGFFRWNRKKEPFAVAQAQRGAGSRITELDGAFG